ncbi:MAG TPA: peptidoglycan DD-metalloendopeptidase family protein [Alphaproteobacteria bacterium]|nr:peptidase M23 [Rhodospirillaceae bacterium]HRJ12657.1 peptidoglycan DD-metalloendopeptidase family protein [Alphaproteobacteria bacterium]
MRLNVFALPALLAFFLSLNSLIAQLPWIGGILEHKPQQHIAETQPEQNEPVREERLVKLASGQTITSLLTAQGITQDAANDAADTLSDVFSAKKFKAGQEFRLNLEHDADGTRLVKLAFAPDATQRIELGLNGEESFTAQRIARETQKRMVAVRGDIDGSFIVSARRAGVPRSVAMQMTRTLSYDVDFQRDIHRGDKFAVMFEAEYDDQGDIIRADNLQYVYLASAKSKPISMYRYDGKMYHADGRDVRRALLKTPVDGARMSSGFGMRRHPVLGYSAMHKGVDFAAPTGTPVYAAGDGKVEKASRFSSYGNYVKIRHNGTYSTAYAHLSRYGKGIRPGARVTQGQVIGYVGSTGRSTGPHLHFEVLQGGAQVNPKKVASLGTDKLNKTELAKFQGMIKQYDTQFASLIAKDQPKLAQNTVGTTATTTVR